MALESLEAPWQDYLSYNFFWTRFYTTLILSATLRIGHFVQCRTITTLVALHTYPSSDENLWFKLWLSVREGWGVRGVGWGHPYRATDSGGHTLRTRALTHTRITQPPADTDFSDYLHLFTIPSQLSHFPPWIPPVLLDTGYFAVFCFVIFSRTQQVWNLIS